MYYGAIFRKYLFKEFQLLTHLNELDSPLKFKIPATKAQQKRNKTLRQFYKTHTNNVLKVKKRNKTFRELFIILQGNILVTFDRQSNDWKLL